MTQQQTPAPDQVHTHNLVSTQASTITNVSLYAERAEITRSFKFAARPGLNQVVIVGLPGVLERESLRVEGRGQATLHDVSISEIPHSNSSYDTSPLLDSLLDRKAVHEKSLDRAKKNLNSLEKFMSTLNAQYTNPADLAQALDHYDETAAIWDGKALRLQRELDKLDREIKAEKDRLKNESTKEGMLNIKVSVNVFAHSEGVLEILLIYAVESAEWSAEYDLRLDMQQSVITLVYKAKIEQSTGEDWSNVPLTLETTNPTFGSESEIPTLYRWNVGIIEPGGAGGRGLGKGGAKRHRKVLAEPDEVMRQQLVEVTSKGNVNASFRIAGLVSIPSVGSLSSWSASGAGGAPRKFTIVQLELPVELSWVSVPREDQSVHMKAKVQNQSEFTFLPGRADVYLDGSFVARNDFQAVSPRETFECSLGLDPTIRITYLPLSKNLSEGGFYTKTTTSTFIQRVQVHNTKTIPVKDLIIMDQVPVSSNSAVLVKLVEPPLTQDKDKEKGQAEVRLGEGVCARWRSGKMEDGLIEWLLSMPAQGKTDLALQYEVSAPAKDKLFGL